MNKNFAIGIILEIFRNVHTTNLKRGGISHENNTDVLKSWG